jgi:acetyl-CoA acetyltransferase
MRSTITTWASPPRTWSTNTDQPRAAGRLRRRLAAKAAAAIEAGRFVDEITPILIPQRKGDPVAFKVDEQPRGGTTAESLAKLRRRSRRTAASPPATPRRSTTAPPP